MAAAEEAAAEAAAEAEGAPPSGEGCGGAGRGSSSSTGVSDSASPASSAASSSICSSSSLAGAKVGSRLLQIALNADCDRVRATEHAPRGPCHLFERRHGLAETVERGAGVIAERPRVDGLDVPRIVHGALPQVAVLPVSRRFDGDSCQLGRRQAQVEIRVAGEDVERLERSVL